MLAAGASCNNFTAPLAPNVIPQSCQTAQMHSSEEEEEEEFISIQAITQMERQHDSTTVLHNVLSVQAQ
jgi:hypothetical protein